MLALLAGSGCSDSATVLADKANALSQHYEVNPLEREWAIRSIKPDAGDNKLVVHIDVLSETDVGRLRGFSRMEQFTAAKLACPVMTPSLRKILGDTRVWVTLSANNKTITSSICPE